MNYRSKACSESKTTTLAGLRRRACRVVADASFDAEHLLALDMQGRSDSLHSMSERLKRAHCVDIFSLSKHVRDDPVVVVGWFASCHVTDSNTKNDRNSAVTVVTGRYSKAV